MNLDKLIILNKVERPCARLLCRELPNGKIIYINKKLRKRYPKLRKSKDYETLKTYGFVEENGKFIQKFDSRATYDDGAIQRWQGAKEFTYKEILECDHLHSYI